MSLELKDVLEFARRYDVIFDIVFEGGEYFIRANLDRVTAKYPIDLGDVSSLAGAVWAALGSVKAGIEFHSVHGYTPGLDLGQGKPGIAGSIQPGFDRPADVNPAQYVHPKTDP